VLVYDSFSRMQAMSERNHHTCYYNDLALLKLKPVDARAAQGALPGMHSPKTVTSHGPASGSHLSSNSSSATAGSTTEGGWLYNLSQAPTFTASDIGTPFVQGGRLIGMLTQLPQGTVMKTEPGISNLHHAIQLLHKSPPTALYDQRGGKHVYRFHHLTLLRAGQRA
jgi:hypothetical protein